MSSPRAQRNLNLIPSITPISRITSYQTLKTPQIAELKTQTLKPEKQGKTLIIILQTKFSVTKPLSAGSQFKSKPKRSLKYSRTSAFTYKPQRIANTKT